MGAKKNTEEKIETVANSIEVDVKEPRKESRKDLRKLIDKDTEVVIMNNTAGMFVYECPRTRAYFELQEYGDTDVMTVEQLNIMKNQHRRILENYWIVPIESIEDGIETSDILRYLSLDSLYKDCEISYETLDNILLNTKYSNFTTLVDKLNNKMVERLVERGVELYKRKKFVDLSKMKVLEKTIGREGFFSELEE